MKHAQGEILPRFYGSFKEDRVDGAYVSLLDRLGQGLDELGMDVVDR